MIFKVFYQKDMKRSPRRETTEVLYLDVKTDNLTEGITKIREQLSKHTDHHIEYIDPLSPEAERYELENNSNFKITKF